MSNGITQSLFRATKTLAKTARLMVGVTDYETYLNHRRTTHPGEPELTYDEFFKARQLSRYGADGGKISRCC